MVYWGWNMNDYFILKNWYIFHPFCRYVVWSFRCVCIKKVLWITTQLSTEMTRISEENKSQVFNFCHSYIWCFVDVFLMRLLFFLQYLIDLYRYCFSSKGSHLLFFPVIQMLCVFENVQIIWTCSYDI